jgi:hypothetical protein
MNDCIRPTKTRSVTTPRASLAAIGALIREHRILEPIRQGVHIPQKTIHHSPTDKLLDALIAILGGAQGLVEVNTIVRSDVALQRAFGRRGCADQSTIQDTLNHATATTVAQLEQALEEIFIQHSAASWHDYHANWQILDIDLSAIVCGKRAEGATKGYFNRQYHRRGRQLARVVASRSDEVVVDQMYAGNTHLGPVLSQLIGSAERRLGLEHESDVEKRARTLVRLDAGGGGLESCNFVLSRGYALLAKDYSSQRAARLAKSVTRWVDDPRCAGRQVGWVQAPSSEYARPVLRLAVRCRSKSGRGKQKGERWRTAVLITTLWPEEALSLVFLSAAEWRHPDAELLALVYLYDGRGGGAETTFKGDKGGLGLAKRNKRHWQGQQVLTLLSELAHNLVVWSRRWLAAAEPTLRQNGIRRMVRDVYRLHGRVILTESGRVLTIVLVVTTPLTQHVGIACRKLFGMHSIVIRLGKT